MTEMGVTNVKVKVMKIGTHTKLEEVLYIWFRQQRENSVPVTGVLLQEKTKLFYQRLCPDATTHFFASVGFCTRYIKQHTLRCISVQGEQDAPDIISVCEFQRDFQAIVSGYDTEQMFNCDETGLKFRLLPQKTLAHTFEKRTEGSKKSKDCVTIFACANATGTIKLPLFADWKCSSTTLLYTNVHEELDCCLQSPKMHWSTQQFFCSGFMNIFCRLSERNCNVANFTCGYNSIYIIG